MDNLLEQSMLCDVDDHGEAVNDTLEVEVYIASFAITVTVVWGSTLGTRNSRSVIGELREKIKTSLYRTLLLLLRISRS